MSGLLRDMDPEKGQQLVNTLMQQGQITDHDFNALKQTYGYLKKAIRAVTKGEVEQVAGGRPEKPREGSFYAGEKERREEYQDPGGFAKMKKLMVQYISAGEQYKDEINQIIMQELMNRRKAGRS